MSAEHYPLEDPCYYFYLPKDSEISLKNFMNHLARLICLQDLKLEYLVYPDDPLISCLYTHIISALRNKVQLRKAEISISDHDMKRPSSNDLGFNDLLRNLGPAFATLQELNVSISGLSFENFTEISDEGNKFAPDCVSITAQIQYIKGLSNFVKCFQPGLSPKSSLNLDLIIEKDDLDDLIEILTMPLKIWKLNVKIETESSSIQKSQRKILKLFTQINGPKEVILGFSGLISAPNEHDLVLDMLNKSSTTIEQITVSFYQRILNGLSRFTFQRDRERAYLKEHYIVPNPV